MTRRWVAQWVASPVQGIVWCLDINTADGSPSLSKMLALAFGVTAARDAWRGGFTATNVAAMALVVSAAFGRSVFMNWLGRSQFTAALSQTNARTVSEVIQRRDPERGIDPA